MSTAAQTFSAPIELVERLVTPTGLAFMVRARLAGAVFKSRASVFIRQDRFVAGVEFVEPIYAEKQSGLVVMLSVTPSEQRAIESLPDPFGKPEFRWSATHKMNLVETVQRGLLAKADLVSLYGVSEEEFDGWADRLERFGFDGLRTRKLQACGR